MTELPPEFLEYLKKVRGKRARVVIEHLLKHGFITTEQLERDYGYKHPPRAIRDVREAGVPIEKYTVESTDGKRIAAYRFGDPAHLQPNKLKGRHIFSSTLKREFIAEHGAYCQLCQEEYVPQFLQVDHRVPYEIAGEAVSRDKDEYMLVCRSCNRAKSWTCEHCPNWQMQEIGICESCFWANPTAYEHIATVLQRQLILTFVDEQEIALLMEIMRKAEQAQMPLNAYLKDILKQWLSKL